MLHPRARTMLTLALPALLIGIASSVILLFLMRLTGILQTFLWQTLPLSIGVSLFAPGWIITVLTFTGIAVGLIIRFFPGHGGPDPASEPLISTPVERRALPGLILAMVLGLAGGREPRAGTPDYGY